MGGVDALVERLRQTNVVGLDTMVFIYAFERHPDYGSLAQAIFRAMEGELFQRFPGLTVADADTIVMERMSDLRVRYGIPTPDAIHLGTALARGAGAFVTNDARLQRVTEMDVLLLSEFV